MTIARDGEVEHVGRNHAVVDDVGAARRGAVDERGGDRRRRQTHIAADGDPVRFEIRDEPGTDRARHVLVDLGRVNAAHVVSFEDIRIDVHISAISYQLSAIGYQLSAISYRLSAISYRLSAIGYQLKADS
ncbi:MAG: hypothetical protein DMF99_11315 [Acidobacteria bacterium]|nr:MAG: hypothetical protein DMF99_11315 [Acidobacteriota bacterium]